MFSYDTRDSFFFSVCLSLSLSFPDTRFRLFVRFCLDDGVSFFFLSFLLTIVTRENITVLNPQQYHTARTTRYLVHGTSGARNGQAAIFVYRTRGEVSADARTGKKEKRNERIGTIEK